MNQRFIDYFIYNNNTFEITKLEDVDLSVIIEESEFVNTSFNIDFYNSHNKNDDDDEQTDTASEGENEKNICLLENLGTFSNDFLKFPIFDDVSIQNSNLQEQIGNVIYSIDAYHQPTTINNNLDLSCPQCFRQFSKKCYLIQHFNSVHVFKPYSCTKCHKRFDNNFALLNHIEKHNQKAEKRFKCNLCTKSYVYKADLKIHKLNKHNKNERLHACDYCGKQFARKDHFLNHKRTHHTHHKRTVNLKREREQINKKA